MTFNQAAVLRQVIGLPTLLWLGFLGWRVGPSLRKLQRSQSHIMTTYYAFLWVVGLLNVLRCLAYIGQVEASKPLLLNLLWLLTRFGATPPALGPLHCLHACHRLLHAFLRLCEASSGCGHAQEAHAPRSALGEAAAAAVQGL